MRDANILVLQRSTYLWIGSGLLLGFIIFAASLNSRPLIDLALALTAAFALIGIAFGIWAARKVTARE